MNYQLRHSNFGLYQGSCMGMGFWYPMSEMPEQGICKFPSLKDIEEYIKFLTTGADEPLNINDLKIEEFDSNLDRTISIVGIEQNLSYVKMKQN